MSGVSGWGPTGFMRILLDLVQGGALAHFPTLLGRRELALQDFLQSVQHPDTLLVSSAESAVLRVSDVPLESGHIEMMDALSCLAPTAVNAFDLVPNMPVVVLLGQLRWSTVRGTPSLCPQFETFLRRPLVADLRYVDVQAAQSLVDHQVLHVQEVLLRHARSSL
ncbi:MAG: hypothetical protein A3K19_20425 [Lentisphaerae bacterium RIFOXYB12_FULL_65_16]|nr:MAG: hypothetical protein A3K18_32695 [Lentisphaerae bacterium RIFOXYA12_64_32]OGV89328.1 MAG: hypothetical protein A3K19_20425 [Lentisphaerae bacterium RIFOXYB12_FULL_65_16]